MRLVIHAGFHKTGTKSVQTALRSNADLLRPHLRVLLRPDVPKLIDAARGYSRRRRPRPRQNVCDAAAALFAGLDTDDTRPVLISAEDLCGYLPGRQTVYEYNAVPVIMAEIERAAGARFGPALDLTFYFSTRSPKAWLESLWWQNLRGTRLDMSLKRYLRVAEPLSDLDGIVAAVAAEVSTARVEAVPLEISTALPHGPLAPILELVDLPEYVRGALAGNPPQNARPDLGLEEIFRALNGSGLPDDVVVATKKTLLRAARGMEEDGT